MGIFLVNSRRTILLVTSILLAVHILRPAQSHAAPVQWPSSGGGNDHFYEAVVVSSGITWSNANIAATQAGGYLATFTSAAEDAFAFSLAVSVPSLFINGTIEGPWLGGYQIPGSDEPDGGWRWVTTEPWAYESWLQNEPNNSNGIEQFLHIAGLTGGWNDEKSTKPMRGYIIEYDSAPPIKIDRIAAYTLDSGGGPLSSPSFISVSSAGQGRAVGFVNSAAHLNSAGFLNSDDLSLSSTDDNDNDGLNDWAELVGSLFDPNATTSPFLDDTDGDGQTDGDEANAGTNPNDAFNLLAITGVTSLNGQIFVTWMSREGKEYELICGTSVAELLTNGIAVAEATASAGVGPWAITSSQATDTNGPSRGFYQIRLKP